MVSHSLPVVQYDSNDYQISNSPNKVAVSVYHAIYIKKSEQNNNMQFLKYWLVVSKLKLSTFKNLFLVSMFKC